MKKFFLVLKVFMIIILVIVSFMAVWWFLPENTPSISGEHPNSIAEIRYYNIGDIDQCVLIRSENKEN